ncbi:hypothetical protein [Actinocorallia libanotica]|uniref:DUF3592 domain-containing protein n=1 Tax=Actinocorallia libanotica TaxID=46162 RepID=A0ABP4CE88_9ACTN
MSLGNGILVLVLMGMPGLGFLGGSLLVAWEILRAKRLDRVAVIAPEPGWVVSRRVSRGTNGMVIAHIGFTTVEGEEAVARLLTRGSFLDSGREIRIRYDPADPGRADFARDHSYAAEYVALLVFVVLGIGGLILPLAVLISS